MNTNVLNFLTAVPLEQPAGSVVGKFGQQEEGAAFRVLMENLLFETMMGQVLKENGGLLTGAHLGLFDDNGQEEQQQGGDQLLALLELLQVPLMEQLRAAQPEGLFSGESWPGGKAEVSTPGVKMPVPPVIQSPEKLMTGDIMGRQPINLSGGFEGLTFNPELLNDGNQPSVKGLPVSAGALAAERQGQQIGLDGKTLFQDNTGAHKEFLPGFKAETLPAPGMNQENVFPGVVLEQPSQNGESVPLSPGLQQANRGGGLSFAELTEQLLQSEKLKLLGDKKEVEIKLKPEYLGKLAIRLSLENGVMTARFLVEHQHVGRMLESNLPQLRQTLEDQGVRFEQVQVEVGDPGSFQEKGQGWHQPDPGKGYLPGQRELQEEPGNEQVPVSTGVIDYRA